MNVVLPEPVGPVNTVNSPRRCPFNNVFRTGYLFHCHHQDTDSCITTLTNTSISIYDRYDPYTPTKITVTFQMTPHACAS